MVLGGALFARFIVLLTVLRVLGDFYVLYGQWIAMADVILVSFVAIFVLIFKFRE